PGATKPVKPSPIKPEQPGATKPVKPSPIKPEQPGATKPVKPSPTKPKQPGTTKPAEPSTSEPKQPSSTKPAESGTTIPEQSSTNTSQITGLNNGTTDSNVTVPNGQDSVGSTGNGSLAVAADQSGQVSKAVTLPQTSENHQSLLIAILGLALLLLMLVWLPAK
ncbi:LPXTG cell wall anchor domain-containing protein, partial [Lactiplantibacillus plantarum]|uniref:LPXTG cell wall anchor domain-containing protein n=1 Tax=Lactiplantibacillus plantarum TaxID=1590 RepID=UPI003F53B740